MEGGRAIAHAAVGIVPRQGRERGVLCGGFPHRMSPLFFWSVPLLPNPPLAEFSAWEWGAGGSLVAIAVGVGWWWCRQPAVRRSELRASEARIQALFDSAAEGVYENLTEGGFRRVNPAMARILGYDGVEELLKLSAQQIAAIYVAPKRREEFFSELGTGDCVTNFESEIRRPDGTTAWISESVRAVRDEAGRLTYLQGFVSDITARKQAEASLRASERRYRELFMHSPVAIFEIDSRGTLAALRGLREKGVTDLAAWFAAEPAEAAKLVGNIPILDMNAMALQMLAAKSIHEVRANLAKIFTPEAVEMRRRALLAVWTGQNVTEGETRIVALDGTVRVVYQRWWAPVDEGRPLFERTQLAFVDLTKANVAESALAAERERLGVTLRAMTEGVVTLDTSGTVQFMNEAAGTLTGWAPGTAVGRPIEEVCVLSDEKNRTASDGAGGVGAVGGPPGGFAGADGVAPAGRGAAVAGGTLRTDARRGGPRDRCGAGVS